MRIDKFQGRFRTCCTFVKNHGNVGKPLRCAAAQDRHSDPALQSANWPCGWTMMLSGQLWRSEMCALGVHSARPINLLLFHILRDVQKAPKIANKWPPVSFEDSQRLISGMSTWHAASIQLTCLVTNFSFGFFASRTLKDQGARINVLLHTVGSTPQQSSTYFGYLSLARSGCLSDSMLRLLSLICRYTSSLHK